MFFADVTKLKGKDRWFVVQGRIIEGDAGYTVGDIVYDGKGGPVILEHVIDCLRNIETLPHVNVGIDQIAPALGYKSGSALRRYTISAAMRLDEYGGIEASIRVGPELDCMRVSKCSSPRTQRKAQ